jgi:glyoxylase-like metal-dependent hydrolase (beta-lactamase superfamily II)
MAVTCLTTGVVRPKARARGLRRYLPGGWADTTLPVNVFLVEHERGLCLFDAGQEAAAARPGYFPRWHPFMWLSRFELSPADEVLPQLRSRGIAPEDVRWVVLSHLHTDHVGGLAPFAGAEVLVSRVEWERAQGLGGRIRGYVPQHWPVTIAPRLVDFDGPAVGPFPASQDLTGDGVLVLVPTPGHTPGHLCLIVRDGDGGFLLGGDLAHRNEDLPAEVAEFCRREGLVYLAAHDERASALTASLPS